jgi:hypothetical protein
MMQITGRCHCGQITFDAELDPADVGVCHCTDCQVLSGSPYRVSARVPAASFHLRSGHLKVYVKTAESGGRRAQSFCPVCGTPIHSSDPVTPTVYSVRVGCIDQRAALPPARQTWCRSALPWSRDLTSLPARERQ